MFPEVTHHILEKNIVAEEERQKAEAPKVSIPSQTDGLQPGSGEDAQTAGTWEQCRQTPAEPCRAARRGKPQEDGALPERLPDFQHCPEERTGHQDHLQPPPDLVLPVADLRLLSRSAVDIGGSQGCHHLSLRTGPEGGLHQEGCQETSGVCRGDSCLGHQRGERARPGADVCPDRRRGSWTGLPCSRASRGDTQMPMSTHRR